MSNTHCFTEFRSDLNIRHHTCFLHLLMIWGIFPCLQHSLKTYLKWLAMIAKPLTCPLQRAFSNRGPCVPPLLRPYLGETFLAIRPGSCCWMSFVSQATEYSLHTTSIFFYTVNFKAQSCILLSNANVKCTLRPKTLFAFANSPNAGIVCAVARDRHGWSSLLSTVLLQTLSTASSTAWEVCESWGRVLLPVSDMCLWRFKVPLCK